jgi:hypothetical protein
MDMSVDPEADTFLRGNPRHTAAGWSIHCAIFLGQIGPGVCPFFS